MFKTFKKILVIGCAAVLVLALSVAAFAAVPQGMRGNRENAPFPKTQNDGSRSGPQRTNPGAFSKVIAALSDDDAATLSVYISTLEDASAAAQAAHESADENADLSSYRENVRTAMQALMTAAKDAGIDLGVTRDSPAEKAKGGPRVGGNPGAFSKVIAALSDDDAAALSVYISALENASAAAKAAHESADENADLSSYRENVRTAMQALMTAAKDAGINLKPFPPSK